MVRKVTVKRLIHLGYRILEASSAQEAIDVLTTGTPVDLVFTDVVMPGGMTGYDLADWLSTHRKDVRVLLTSGYNDPGSHNKDGSRTYNIMVLNKPYPMDLLAMRVSEAMEPNVEILDS